jgi:Ca-activated chloride channel family protein
MVDARGDKLPALPGSEPKLPLAPVLHPDEGKLNPVKLAIHLNAGVPLAHLSSPHHQIVASNWQGGESEITLGDGVVPADRDFELIWAPVPGAKPVMALFQERLDDETFMLAMVMPPAAEQAPPPMARDVVFVLDRSGSMAGSSIRQARKALVFALERLRPEDRFNIIRFDNKTETLFPALRTATKNIVRRAIDYVRGTEARGGTNMRPALLAALAGTPADSRLRQIIFLTDAAIGNEAALFDAIASRIGQNRLFTVGIGSAPNSYFMQRAAELGRGSFTYIGNTQKVGDTMQALFRKIERPMATALSVQWDGLPTDTHRIETYPNRLPDLYDGGPIVLAARIVGPDPLARASALTISGTVDTAPWRQTIDLAAAKPVIGGGTLWGRAKISNLMMSIHQGADPASVKQAVTVTALRHHIVSRYTSLVATEKEVTRPADEPIFPRTVPRNLPDGWDFEKAFGDVLKTKPASIVPISTPPVPPAADKLRHAGLAVHKAARRGAPAKQLASVAKPRLSSNPTSSPMALASRTVRLPAGSTSAALNLIVGIIALLVGIILMRRKRMS